MDVELLKKKNHQKNTDLFDGLNYALIIII